MSVSRQPDTSRSRETMDVLMHRVVCPFTPQFLLELINRVSWRRYTAAAHTGFEPATSRDRKFGTVPYGHDVAYHADIRHRPTIYASLNYSQYIQLITGIHHGLCHDIGLDTLYTN